MVDKQVLKCCKCTKSANYRNKIGKMYCEKCYWELEENKHKKRSWETYQNSEIYKECPHCKAGDLCGIGWCNSQCSCGVYHPEGKVNCSTCNKREKEELNQKKEQLKAELNDCYAKVAQINQKDEENLIVEDWETLKVLQNKAKLLAENKSWLKDDLSAQASWIETDIDYLQKCLQEMELIFPEELKVKNKSKVKKGKAKIKKVSPCSPIKEKLTESRIKNQESRIKNQESRIKNQESRIKNQPS